MFRAPQKRRARAPVIALKVAVGVPSILSKVMLTWPFRCRRMQRETNQRVKSKTGRAIFSTSMAATGEVSNFLVSLRVVGYNINNIIINTWLRNNDAW